MELEIRIETLRNALNQSFVDDYESFNNIIESINEDLRESKVDFQYTYDEFCVDFLNESLRKIEKVDLFKTNSFESFYNAFWRFNIETLISMMTFKMEELGLSFDEFYRSSKIKSYLNSSTSLN